ncbi:MAG: hypothetical protein WC340_10930 [Kiritimatiellia bacterium]
MNSYRLILTAALLSLSAAAQVKVSDFPADTKMLAHIDMKALVNSKVGDLIKAAMDEKTNRKLDAFKAMSGIDVMKDLDSIFFLGGAENEGSGVLYASGRFDIKKLTAILGGNGAFKSNPYGAHQILSWSDNEQDKYGCFVNPTLAVLADDLTALKKSLSVIDGKGARLASASPLAPVIKSQSNRFAALYANKLDVVAESVPQLAMLKQANALELSVGQASAEQADLLLNASLSTATLEEAQQMGAMVMGLQALLMIQAQQNPEMAALAQNFKSEVKDKTITMNLKVTAGQLKQQLADAMKKANAKPVKAPAAPPMQ